jgi:hypothetical protein
MPRYCGNCASCIRMPEPACVIRCDQGPDYWCRKLKKVTAPNDNCQEHTFSFQAMDDSEFARLKKQVEAEDTRRGDLEMEREYPYVEDERWS